MAESLDEKIDNLSRLMERVLVKLFGDVDGETPTGRLPMLEAKQVNHEERIKRIENFVLKIFGAAAVLGAFIGLVEAASRLASAVKH